ncbi:hypothetical protein WA158_006927 [Blastocystis sp. Blastoise]
MNSDNNSCFPTPGVLDVRGASPAEAHRLCLQFLRVIEEPLIGESTANFRYQCYYNDTPVAVYNAIMPVEFCVNTFQDQFELAEDFINPTSPRYSPIESDSELTNYSPVFEPASPVIPKLESLEK